MSYSAVLMTDFAAVDPGRRSPSGALDSVPLCPRCALGAHDVCIARVAQVVQCERVVRVPARTTRPPPLLDPYPPHTRSPPTDDPPPPAEAAGPLVSAETCASL